MSHSAYNHLWSEAQEELDRLLTQELPSEPQRPERDRLVFFQNVATLYVRYVQVFRQLEETYDQSVHPQKRRVIRLVLDGVMGRVLELKNEMVENEFSEYHYMDDILQDLKLTPEDLDIPIPRYFIRERNKVLEERDQLFASISEKMMAKEKTEPPVLRMLTLERAIRVIQLAERARQGRLRAKFMREIHRVSARKKKKVTMKKDQAAIRIQKVWRGFLQRKRTKKLQEEELISLGMVLDPKLIYPTPSELLAKRNKASKQTRQEEHEEDYLKSCVTVLHQLSAVEGPDMMESMKDQIRQWFFECRDGTGSFPDYPDEEDGGSALIFSEKTPEEMMAELAAKDDTKKEDEKDKKKKDNKTTQDAEAGLKMQPSAYLSDLEKGQKKYTDIWKTRNESKNISQKHEVELIKEEKRKEVEMEIRKQVDVVMRQELANLKLTMDKEKGKISKGAAKKKKPSKAEKKKKKEKDLTVHRTIESLFEELVLHNMLKKPDDVKLEDYLGDYSYLGTTLRQADVEPMPSLSDVRQLIALYAVLPLGSPAVNEKVSIAKTILLVGPSGVGKKMLVHAICRESGANLFDLSPLNVARKYPGRNGLQMMLNVVFKVARQMQPSVIWIGDAEKMFYKKIPKEEKELDPKRLKKDLPKILKTLKEDCILFVGTTKDPHSADLKSFCKFFEKIILIPRPDYASRYVMWKDMIYKFGGEVTNALDLSSLAKISDGYTQGHMVQVVRSILTKRRIQQFPKRPLTASEFVIPLARIEPVFQDEEEALKDWYSKTPLGRQRCKAALGKTMEEERAKKDKKEKK